MLNFLPLTRLQESSHTVPQEPLCHTSTRPEQLFSEVSPPLSRSFSLSEKAAAPPVTAPGGKEGAPGRHRGGWRG